MIRLILGIAILVGTVWLLATKREWLFEKLGKTTPTAQDAASDTTPSMVTKNGRDTLECRADLIRVGEDILGPLTRPTTYSPQQAGQILSAVEADLRQLTARDPLAQRYLSASQYLRKALKDRSEALDRYKNPNAIGSPMDRPVGSTSKKRTTSNQPGTEDFFKRGVLTAWNSLCTNYRRTVSPMLAK